MFLSHNNNMSVLYEGIRLSRPSVEPEFSKLELYLSLLDNYSTRRIMYLL